MPSRRFFMISTAAALLLAPRFAKASEAEILSYDGAAIGGYDPVAYFSEGEPVKGKAAHAVTWQGAEWRFATDANRETFEANPEAYAPQYGGYCAYAASKGAVAPTAPDAWTVHDGKLYLNFSQTVRGIWSEDIPGNIAKADANWPAPLSK
ncbi:YHS domain-containing (seleno)protein [Roseovarius indicus]|uniref:YHS domain-containing (seleno)protein n=1 Tax=Roseovarius indicus TaxID=540747 RepID=UPI0032EF4AC5